MGECEHGVLVMASWKEGGSTRDDNREEGVAE